MPRKSKPFIDKKNATSYHLYHRSQRDTENETGSASVLLPSTGDYAPPSDASVMSMSVLQKELEKIGVLHDDITEASDNYDYSQHIRPISGTGVYYSSDGKRASQNYVSSAASLLGEENVIVEEVPRQLDSIMLSTECMDEEIAHALFDDIKDDQYEEILDDFCITANEEIIEEDNEDDDDHVVKVIEFDYETHIEGLLRKAKQEEEEEDDVSEIGDDDHYNNKQFFQGVKPLNAREIIDDYNNNKPSKDNNRHGFDDNVTAISYKTNQTCSLQKLEETLAEYDSEDIGSLQDECEDIQGFRNGEDGQDQLVNNALAEFLEESKDDFYIRGEHQKGDVKEDQGGSGYKALVGTKLIPVEQLNSDANYKHPIEKETIEERLQEADDILAQPYEKPPIEDVLIDGKSYYSIKSHNPWDCETILTTYSNLDNHPTTIGRSKKYAKSNKPHKPQIQLSTKTGLPIFAPQEYYDEHYDSEEDEIVNSGVRRNKKETLEEKKARKELLKQDKREKRVRKQGLKVAFKDEFQKHATLLVNDDVGGKSVFRYS